MCYYRSDVTHVATVEVKAAGLNFADVFACLGLYSAYVLVLVIMMVFLVLPSMIVVVD